MKQFSCGDVIPGCQAVFQDSKEEEIVSAVREHARQHHGVVHLPDSLVSQVLSNTRELSA